MSLKERLLTHLTHIARERDPYLATEGHFYVQQYIREHLEQWGTVETHKFKINTRIHTNLILNLPARPGRADKPPILIGAHYDAVPGTQGADDNASGVAVLLELARLLYEEPAYYPVQLIAFDLEEYGMLGSNDYAQALSNQQRSVRLMLSLEMLGYCTNEPKSQHYPTGMQYFYPNKGNFVGLIGNVATIPDLIHLSRSIKGAGIPAEWLLAGKRGMLVRATRLSDHSPFWDQGYRAIMATDTAFMRNPNYHKPSDRIETLDLNFMTGICEGLAEGLRRL